jgi:hypothetical protein
MSRVCPAYICDVNRTAEWLAAGLAAALALAPVATAQDAKPDAGHAPEDEYELELPPAGLSVELKFGRDAYWIDIGGIAPQPRTRS